MTVLQCIPIISNTGGVPTLAPILTIMVCASGALKLVEVRRALLRLRRAFRRAYPSWPSAAVLACAGQGPPPRRQRGQQLARPPQGRAGDPGVGVGERQGAPPRPGPHPPTPSCLGAPAPRSRRARMAERPLRPPGVQVGDLIQIRNHEPVPADVLVMAAHEPDPAIPRGSCHVETKGLDGETNLKARNPTLL